VAIEGVDYSSNHPALEQLHFLGKWFVCRYIGPGVGKILTGAEATAIVAAGMSVVFLAEGFERDALLGHAKGVEHAQAAAYDIRTHNWPRDRPVYFAVDFDMQVADRPAVRDYLAGCASVLGLANVGVYGGIRCTEWAANNRYASWFFQTYAWSDGAWGPAADIQQYRNGVNLAGGQVDLCRGMSTNYGQWPHAVETIGTAPAAPAPVVTTGPWDFTGAIAQITSRVSGLAATLTSSAATVNRIRG
jgi:Domain of unknown function (DUF1906)